MSTLTVYELINQSLTLETFKPFYMRFKNQEDFQLFHYDLFVRTASPMQNYIADFCEDNPDNANTKPQFTKHDHMYAARSAFCFDYLLKLIEIDTVPWGPKTKEDELMIFLENRNDFAVFSATLLAGSQMSHAVMKGCYQHPELAEKALKAMRLWKKHEVGMSTILSRKKKNESEAAAQTKNAEEASNNDSNKLREG